MGKAPFMSAKKRAGIVAALLLPVASPAAHAGVVMLWNDALLSIAQQTSGLLTNGPPEIAWEIAMVDTAMYDAVNAATGQTYKPYAYAPGPMNASADAAALQAGFTVMQSIFSNPVWGAPVSASILPQITQSYTAGLAGLQPGPGTTLGLSIGPFAGNTMVALRANNGATAAIQAGLKTFIPPGSGSVPGVYIPPANRPAMFPTWGSVTPFTMTSSSQFPVLPAPAITSAGVCGLDFRDQMPGPGRLVVGASSVCLRRSWGWQQFRSVVRWEGRRQHRVDCLERTSGVVLE